MALPVVGLIVGLIIGIFAPISIPVQYAKYMSVAVLASLDSVFGGLRAGMEEKFDNMIFVSGFFTNAALAAILVYIGDRLGIDILCGLINIWFAHIPESGHYPPLFS